MSNVAAEDGRTTDDVAGFDEGAGAGSASELAGGGITTVSDTDGIGYEADTELASGGMMTVSDTDGTG